jgi:hypothetical protein
MDKSLMMGVVLLLLHAYLFSFSNSMLLTWLPRIIMIETGSGAGGAMGAGGGGGARRGSAGLGGGAPPA